MQASAWKGGTYGIRVGSENADRYFAKEWKFVDVDLDGQYHRVRLRGTFWGKCPELRGAAFGDWLLQHGLVPWPRGNPPRLELIPVEGNKFRLHA
jgi:hypothetical protein